MTSYFLHVSQESTTTTISPTIGNTLTVESSVHISATDLSGHDPLAVCVSTNIHLMFPV